MRKRWILGILLVTSVLHCRLIAFIEEKEPTATVTPDASVDTTKVVGQLENGAKVEIFIDVVAAPKEDIFADSERWGSDPHSFPPKRLVKKIRAFINSKMVLLPMSAYSDLSEPRDPQLKIRGNNFDLLLKGSDGALGYRVKFSFSNGKLLKRKVCSTLAPVGWEETKYFYSTAEFD